MKRIIHLCSLITTLGIVFLSGACASTSKKHDPDFLGNYPVQSLGVLHLNIVRRYSNDLLPRDVSFVFEPSTNLVKFHHKMMGDNIWISLKKNECPDEELSFPLERFVQTRFPFWLDSFQV